MPQLPNIVPAIVRLVLQGTPRLVRGRISVLGAADLEEPLTDLDRALENAAPKKWTEDSDNKRVLKLKDAVQIVEDVMNETTVPRAVGGFLVNLLIGGDTGVPNISVAIGDELVKRLREKVLRQDIPREYIRVSQGGQRGRPPSGQGRADDSYGARRRGSKGAG